MMQNPMFMNMAQQLMQNGGLENLMSNPALSNMVRCPPVYLNFLWTAHKLITLDEPRTIWQHAVDGGNHERPDVTRYVRIFSVDLVGIT